MKVRIGFGLGTQAATAGPGFATLVDELERLGFDSLWLSERVGAAGPHPTIGLAVAAGRTERLKLGTSVQVLPGRNPAVLAKEWATLDVLSGGRALPAFGLGVADPREQQAFGVQRGERAPWLDEVLPLLRRLWTEDAVDHAGPRFSYEGLRVLPKPVQQPPDVWLGGQAPSELRRVGRLGDGWLASFRSPAQVATARAAIDEEAAAHRRRIDPEHYGSMVFYVHGQIPEAVTRILAHRNPDVDPGEVVAVGPTGVRARCTELVDVGFSKLVVVPLLVEPDDWTAELEALAGAVLDLQT